MRGFAALGLLAFKTHPSGCFLYINTSLFVQVCQSERGVGGEEKG